MLIISVDNKLRVSEITDLQGNSFPDRRGEKIEYLFDEKYSSYARFAAFLFGNEPYPRLTKHNTCHTLSNEGKRSYDVVFQLDTPVELTMYSLVTGFRLDVPDKWILYGTAAKDEPWVLLDEQFEFPRPVTNFTEKAFAIGIPGSYRFYRFTFIGQDFILSQVHLYT